MTLEDGDHRNDEGEAGRAVRGPLLPPGGDEEVGLSVVEVPEGTSAAMSRPTPDRRYRRRPQRHGALLRPQPGRYAVQEVPVHR